MVNQITVGFPITVQLKDEDGDLMWKPHSDLRLRSKGQSEPVLKTFGTRVMHFDMLGRIAQYMKSLGEDQVVRWVMAWCDQSSADLPDPSLAPEKIKWCKDHEAAHKSVGKLKIASYFEAAAFCIEAWIAALPGR